MLKDKIFVDEQLEAEIWVKGKKKNKDKRDRYFSHSDYFYSPFGRIKGRGYVGEIEVHIDEYTLSDYFQYKDLEPHITITLRRGVRNKQWMYFTSTLEAFEETTLWNGLSESEQVELKYAYFKQKDDIETLRDRIRNALSK